MLFSNKICLTTWTKFLSRKSTRTEFIRDVIRDELNVLKKEKLAEDFLKFQGKSVIKTNRKDNWRVAEEVLLKFARERGLFRFIHNFFIV